MRNQMIYLRAKAGMTIEQEAKRLGYTHQLVSLIERGERTGSLDFWIKFCDLHKIKTLGELKALLEREND